MSLYDDIDVEPATSNVFASTEHKKVLTPAAATESEKGKQQQQEGSSLGNVPPTPTTHQPLNKLNLSFLKSQLEAKKALLQNTKSAVTNAQSPNLSTTSPMPSQQEQVTAGKAASVPRSTFKLKPHRAMPLPLDTGGAFTLIPKSLKEDKVFLFGECMIEDEYNPTQPTDYASFKQKREQQRLKEKIAKEIAERLARETSEEEYKRKRGVAIAPPMQWEKPEPVLEQPQEEQQLPQIESPRLVQFGKNVSRGLGVAANIMSRMGYRDGAGLGAKEQGISRPLEVQRSGRNVGLIVGEEKASTVVTHLSDGEQLESKAVLKEGWAERNTAEPIPITELLKSASKIVLVKNMVLPSQVDADFEQELREEMGKYGQLVGCVVHQMGNCAVDSDSVRVFLEFSSQAQAIKAVVDLNGRFFAGNQVRALFYPLEEYNNRKLDLAL